MTDPGSNDRPRRVLFICTGNYYRSRFAEALFNHLARERGLAWQADSRGTDLDGAGRWNVGPISDYAREALEARGIPVGDEPRMPAQLRDDDLATADLAIAVCEHEHRPYVERAHPDRSARVEYWSVDDLGVTSADDALAALREHVEGLIDRLAAQT